MFKQGLKNYWHSLKYFFLPLGIFALFVALGVSISISMCSHSINTLIQVINEAVESAKDTDWTNVLMKILEMVEEVSHNEPAEVFRTVFSIDWLKNALISIVQEMLGGAEAASDFINNINIAVAGIFSAFLTLFVIAVVGLVLGFFAVRLMVRKETTKKSLLKAILFSIVDSIIFGLLFWLGNYLSNVALWLFVVYLVVLFLFSGYFAILEGYLFYGIKKIKLKEVAKLTNVLLLYLVNLLIAAITVGLVLLFGVLIGGVFGIFVAVPFGEIGICVIFSNGEGYVAQKAHESKKKQVEKA